MPDYQPAQTPYQIPPQVLQTLMQHLQQQQLQQQTAARIPMQNGAVGGPMPAATPPTMPGATPQQGNTPMAGGPVNITGGGTPILSMAGVSGNVPLGGNGVPAMQPTKFSGAPGGSNAPGGGSPYHISPNLKPPGSAGSGQQLKMDNFGNYYYGTDPNATSSAITNSASSLLQQSLNPGTSSTSSS